jgi:hypothetical protein
VHERRSDEACQALIGKQVPGPISFTSAEEPCRTAILKAFHKICLLPNSPGGILLRRQDLGLVLTGSMLVNLCNKDMSLMIYLVLGDNRGWP